MFASASTPYALSRAIAAAILPRCAARRRRKRRAAAVERNRRLQAAPKLQNMKSATHPNPGWYRFTHH
jgi:hypothetical protein